MDSIRSDVPTRSLRGALAAGGAVGAAVLLVVAVGLAVDPGLAPPFLQPRLELPAEPVASFGVAPRPAALEAPARRLGALRQLAGLLLAIGWGGAGMALSTALGLQAAEAARLRRTLAVRVALGAGPRELLRRALDERVAPVVFVGVVGGSALGVVAGAALLASWPAVASVGFPRLATPLAVAAIGAAGTASALVPLRQVVRDLGPLLKGEWATEDRYEGGIRRVAAVLQMAVASGLLTVVGTGLLHAPGATPAGDPASPGASATWLVPVRSEPDAEPARLEGATDDTRQAETSAGDATEEGDAAAHAALLRAAGGRLDFIMAECMCVRGTTFFPFVGARVTYHSVTPAFFAQAGLELRSGRGLEPGDAAASDPVAVVSASFARDEFRGGDPLGRTVRIGMTWHEVVGVVDEPSWQGVGRSAGSDLAVYLSAFQHPPDLATLALTLDEGTDADEAAAIAAEIVDASAATLTAAGSPRSVRDLRSAERAPLMWAAAVLGGTALLTLLATLAGMASLAAVEVRARRRGLAVRAAVGAPPRALLRWVLGRQLRATGLGLLLSIPWTLLLTALLDRVVGTYPVLDLRAFAVVAVSALLATTAGALVPARRAAGTRPVVALA